MKLDGKKILKIKQAIDLIDDKKIVRIDVSQVEDGWSKHESNFNIYCIDKDDNILWEINEVGSESSHLFGKADPFYYLGMDAEGGVIADRFSGFVYKINPETGEAVRTGFHK